MNKGLCSFGFLILLAFLTNPTLAKSEESDIKNNKHWYTGIILDLGVTFSQVDLDVDKFENGSKVSGGTLSTDISYAPYINIGSPYKYFGNTKFGYNIQLSYSSYNVDKQELKNDDDLKDHDTSANGYYIYGMPVFFYNLGDKYLKDGKGWSVKFGVGVGLGYLSAEGDIILEDLNDGSQEKTSFDVQTDPVDLAAFVLTDIRLNNFLVLIRGGGPWIINHEENGNEFGLFELSIVLGYSFYF